MKLAHGIHDNLETFCRRLLTEYSFASCHAVRWPESQMERPTDVLSLRVDKEIWNLCPKG